MNKTIATLFGFTAILMWATLAVLTAASGQVPPFQLTAITFLIGGLIGALSWPFRPSAVKHLRQPPSVWLFGITGLFGYHFFYYTALRNAPPVEAGLIAYLWPLLIVLFTALLPNERLRWFHIAGALLGFLGCFLIVTGGKGLVLDDAYLFGYGAAGLCALIWSSYSVGSRFLSAVPTDTVAGFCLASALLSAACSALFETQIWPSDLLEWLAILGLGLFPVGIAFYVWDIGMKKGHIALLGAASYAAPLLSTAILILFGFGEFTLFVGAAAALITAGALLASIDLISPKK